MKLITKHNPFSNAFTLAEVLITLTIIGVVAAMTMPTLINNTNGAQFKTAYKKALSVLSQAVVMNIALDDYDFAGTVAYDSSDTNKSTLNKLLSDRMAILAGPYIGVGDSDGQLADYTVTFDTKDFDSDAATKMSDSIDISTYHVFQFNDGIMFAFDPTQNSCTEEAPCFGFIDANGIKGPNKTVTCTVDSGTSTDVGEEEEADTITQYECTDKVTINDIFPVRLYDQTVAPASASARAVLYGSENMTKDDNSAQQQGGGSDGE